MALAWPPETAAAEIARLPLERFGQTTWPTVSHAATVTAVRAARTGHLWIGTTDRLVRFDGKEMVAFDRRRAPGLVEGEISTLFEASEVLHRASRQLDVIAGGRSDARAAPP